jgi:hypothetical protein
MAWAQLKNSPFTMCQAVDLSAVDYVPAADFAIAEIRCKTAGVVKVDTLYSTGISIILGDGDLAPLLITKIYKVGTDAALASGVLWVSGFSYANDLVVTGQ